MTDNHTIHFAPSHLLGRLSPRRRDAPAPAAHWPRSRSSRHLTHFLSPKYFPPPAHWPGPCSSPLGILPIFSAIFPPSFALLITPPHFSPCINPNSPPILERAGTALCENARQHALQWDVATAYALGKLNLFAPPTLPSPYPTPPPPPHPPSPPPPPPTLYPTIYPTSNPPPSPPPPPNPSPRPGKLLGRRVVLMGCSTGATLQMWLAAQPWVGEAVRGGTLAALVLFSPGVQIAKVRTRE